MRVLLIQSSVCVPTFGGASKSNRLLCAALAGRGHPCAILAPACGVQGAHSRAEFHAELRQRKLSFTSEPHADVFVDEGVTVFACSEAGQLRSQLAERVRLWEPDVVLIASEDPGQVLLEAAVRVQPPAIVYLARTTLALPFGPQAAMPHPRGLELLRRVTGIVSVSDYLAEYCREWGSLDAVTLPLSLNGEGPFPHYGDPERGFITMVNPCAYKGLRIFEALALAFPDVSFAAVPTWGATARDREALHALPNVRVLPAVDAIDDVLVQTRVTLVPSLWAEAKGRIIRESMLRGIPVLASDVGGIREAMLGLDYLLPVTPIDRFENRLDDRMMPMAIVPDQNVEPWVEALRTLILDADAYRRLSEASRQRALIANEHETVRPFEQYLLQCSQRSRGGTVTSKA